MKKTTNTSVERHRAEADGANARFALPRADRRGHSRFARIGGKLSRLVARNLVTKALPMSNDRPMVTFTFDDAPATACTTGAQLLEKFGARGTFYIAGGGLGVASPGGQLANAEQIEVLAKLGHEIGCHTFSHASVGSIDQEALFTELECNRLFLQNVHSEIEVRNFAYPYGDLSHTAKRLLEQHFDSCRSLRPGVNFDTADLGALKPASSRILPSRSRVSWTLSPRLNDETGGSSSSVTTSAETRANTA